MTLAAICAGVQGAKHAALDRIRGLLPNATAGKKSFCVTLCRSR